MEDIRAFCQNQTKCWKYLNPDQRSFGQRIDRILRKVRKKIVERFTSIRTAFQSVDYNSNYNIDYNEYLVALDHWGLRAELNPADIQFLFDALDVDQDKLLSWQEFEHFFMKQAIDDIHRRGMSRRQMCDLQTFEQRLLLRFRTIDDALTVMDLNSDNFIDKEEFLKVIERMDYYSKEEAEHLWELIDFKYTGRIAIYDLRKLLSRARRQRKDGNASPGSPGLPGGNAPDGIRVPRKSPPLRQHTKLPFGISPIGLAELQVNRKTSLTVKGANGATYTFGQDAHGSGASVPEYQEATRDNPSKYIPGLWKDGSISDDSGTDIFGENNSDKMQQNANQDMNQNTIIRSKTLSNVSILQNTPKHHQTYGKENKRILVEKKKTNVFTNTKKVIPKKIELNEIKSVWKCSKQDLKETLNILSPQEFTELIEYHTPSCRITPAQIRRNEKVVERREERPWWNAINKNKRPSSAPPRLKILRSEAEQRVDVQNSLKELRNLTQRVRDGEKRQQGKNLFRRQGINQNASTTNLPHTEFLEKMEKKQRSEAATSNRSMISSPSRSSVSPLSPKSNSPSRRGKGKGKGAGKGGLLRSETNAFGATKYDQDGEMEETLVEQMRGRFTGVREDEQRRKDYLAQTVKEFHEKGKETSPTEKASLEKLSEKKKQSFKKKILKVTGSIHTMGLHGRRIDEFEPEIDINNYCSYQEEIQEGLEDLVEYWDQRSKVKEKLEQEEHKKIAETQTDRRKTCVASLDLGSLFEEESKKRSSHMTCKGRNTVTSNAFLEKRFNSLANSTRSLARLREEELTRENAPPGISPSSPDSTTSPRKSDSKEPGARQAGVRFTKARKSTSSSKHLQTMAHLKKAIAEDDPDGHLPYFTRQFRQMLS